MGLETGSFIQELVITNPEGNDPKSQGDDHLRLIKKVLKSTFPNLNGAVTATPAQLNGTASPGSLVPPGIVSMWAGTIANIPAGWKLCNGVGTISNGIPVPDLRDRFVVGAGNLYDPGVSGGSKDAVVVAHTHTGSTDTAGSHVHSWNVQRYSDHSYAGLGGEGNDGFIGQPWAKNPLQPAGDHSHTVTVGSTGVSGVNANLPPYYSLAYIIKN